ncbi:MAG: L-ribulose-5-phosphate 4-epimerase AraD [Bacteroidota bacterium]|jgi:L-ribulose-5-phosphate 4-epimerase
MLKQLKEEVFQANIDLLRNHLVILTWGNVSGISRADGYIVIKPSGVDYEVMKPADMVVVDFDGKIVEGKLRPSSDLPTHLRLYKSFSSIGGIAHTHSLYATMFAQACKEIPCYGTTHADHFNGDIPLTRFLTKEEVAADYEGNTGAVIIERFATLDPRTTPSVLVRGHAPFSWGKNAIEAARKSLILERVAQMALGSLQLNPDLLQLPSFVQEKHFQRKHGPGAYYGQK